MSWIPADAIAEPVVHGPRFVASVKHESERMRNRAAKLALVDLGRVSNSLMIALLVSGGMKSRSVAKCAKLATSIRTALKRTRLCGVADEA